MICIRKIGQLKGAARRNRIRGSDDRKRTRSQSVSRQVRKINTLRAGDAKTVLFAFPKNLHRRRIFLPAVTYGQFATGNHATREHRACWWCFNKEYNRTMVDDCQTNSQRNLSAFFVHSRVCFRCVDCNSRNSQMDLHLSFNSRRNSYG